LDFQGASSNALPDGILRPEFKRLAAIQGDIVYQAPRRFLLENIPETQPAFAFRMFFFSSSFIYFDVPFLSVFKRGKSIPKLGAFHSSDIPEFFGTGVNPDFIGTDALGACVFFFQICMCCS
jgi:hypothetical protein